MHSLCVGQHFYTILALGYIDKSYGFQWALIVLPWLRIFFLFCYKRDFMTSLSYVKQADISDAFNNTSRYLGGILNINNIHYNKSDIPFRTSN